MLIKYGLYLRDYSGNYEDFCESDSSHRLFDTKELCEEYKNVILEKYKIIKSSRKKKTGFLSWLTSSEYAYELDAHELAFMKRFEKTAVVMKVKINIFKDAMSGN